MSNIPPSIRVRSLGGDLVERVLLVDEHRDGARVSETWRVVYRSWERSLTNGEINQIQEQVRRELAARLPVSIR